ncbi:MAG TPA: serine--tRNA ligase [Patescibacteria group bacterium]|nr:serine--tRNA ligase [Patescibacteria group bacterium]
MLDIQFIRDNRELVREKSKQKGYDVDIDQLLGFDTKRRELLVTVEELRRQRNELSLQSQGQQPPEDQIHKGRELKDKLTDLEHQLTSIEQEFVSLLKTVPNMPLQDVPIGGSEAQNVVTKTVGEPHKYDYEAKPHWELLNQKNFWDKERAAKISGSRFVYLKGDIVRLQMALIQYVFDTLGDKEVIERLIKDNNLNLKPTPFMPILPPAMLRTEPYSASSRLNAEEVTYKLEGDDLWLNASAEHTLCTMYWNETLPEDQLPVRYVGYSTSFRREAGTYGKDTEGIIRLHQFDKLEMEVFSTKETGLDEHKLLIAIQEYLIGQLKISYQYVQKCTADIGGPNASGVDLNCWFPGQKRFIETHTADYMTDYQARDLSTRIRKQDGSTELAHTNDATAFALGRILAAIVENYQDKEGNIYVPEVLKPYLGSREKL